MKIGLVGYQGSGKSTLFEWLTGVAPDVGHAHLGQSAMAELRDERLEKLAEIYHPKKIHRAAIELVDTPGLSRDHQGNAARLALLREASCLVLVVAAFQRSDPLADLVSFDEDLLLADMEVVSGRLERIAHSMTKPIPRTEREPLEHERQTLQVVLGAMEAGRPLRQSDMTDEQSKVTRSFRLLSEKPRMILVNTADDEEHPERFTDRSTEALPIVALPAGLELELARMTAEDRAEFEAEMGLQGSDRDALLRRILDVSGHKTFFTAAADKEVRAWLLPKGGTALDAAAMVHTDLARGFIRAEVMTCADLMRVGSEREVKAHHLVRQEPKDYVVGDDDILLVRFSV